MPTKPPQLKGLRHGMRAPTERSRKRRFDQSRPTSGKRLYDWEWQKTSKSFLAEPDNALCVECRRAGLVKAAAEVDHIVPHRGDLELFWDRGNWQGLCRSHHSAKTARETLNSGKRGMARPSWLRPAVVPVVLVCGPPASGKSTYVARHATPGDLVVDLDEIAAGMSGQPKHSWSRRKWLHPALRTRNDILGRLSDRSARWPRAWVIISEPAAENRQWWWDTLCPERIVVLEASADTCLTRAAQDHDRDQDVTCDAIVWWWSRYDRRPGDEVVRG